MKSFFYCFLFFLLTSGCTLIKDELAQNSESNKINLLVKYTINGDSSNYTIILLRDTTDFHHQNPISFFINNQFSLPEDTLRKGCWIVLKKWVSYGKVFETQPLFLSSQVPENTKLVTLTINEIVVSRNVVRELDSIGVNIGLNNGHPWDATLLDDAVSGPLPDFYFTIGNFFTTGPTDFIDQPIGWFRYYFNGMIIPTLTNTLTVNCFDYDFNTSPDEVIGIYDYNIDPNYTYANIVNNGINKEISVRSNYWYDGSILTFKIY